MQRYVWILRISQEWRNISKDHEHPWRIRMDYRLSPNEGTERFAYAKDNLPTSWSPQRRNGKVEKKLHQLLAQGRKLLKTILLKKTLLLLSNLSVFLGALIKPCGVYLFYCSLVLSITYHMWSWHNRQPLTSESIIWITIKDFVSITGLQGLEGSFSQHLISVSDILISWMRNHLHKVFSRWQTVLTICLARNKLILEMYV